MLGDYDVISGLIENLKDMEWEPYCFKLGREGFVKEVQQRSEEWLKELSLNIEGKGETENWV